MSAKEVETDLDAGVLHNSEWVKRWEVGDIAFHQSRYDSLFDSQGEALFPGGAKSVFVPLCGKTPDMIWMYNQGHSVVGVELSEQAVQELFSENKLEARVQHVEGVGPLYTSTDGRLQVYVGDLFDLTKDQLSEFDRVWDSRSLVAINVVDQERYRNLLLSLLKKGGEYYLKTLDYDPTVWPGPPHNISHQRVNELYGEHCNIEILEETNRTGLNPNTPRVPHSDVNPPTDPSGDVVPQAKPSSAGAALKMSSYLYDRWYKLLLK
ncbi:probable thiopurine S-methyltransferase [Dreissena polymorpha]|uniref:probable thiopurine S-methyltransferase n=1 Tax=Dreissena polymorpha TaxID=45954 RepID=UPI002264F85B|nr:probable thiopurine S-methyltransferase [Dreissena polymorpha]XP_052274529.1 probable thiopurine S-methyltransferase [Dreissena polymorpha]